MKQYILIDEGDGGVNGAYGPFTDKTEARGYAAFLDYYYGDKYDPDKAPPYYTDIELFEHDWVLIELTEIDWEQFTK